MSEDLPTLNGIQAIVSNEIANMTPIQREIICAAEVQHEEFHTESTAEHVEMNDECFPLIIKAALKLDAEIEALRKQREAG